MIIDFMQDKEKKIQAKASAYAESTCKIDYAGTKYWRNSEGLCHRTDGPAIERSNGTKCWFLNGKRHRTDGPAIEESNATYWHLNGELHRTDGPAIERSDGIKKWFLNGVETEALTPECPTVHISKALA